MCFSFQINQTSGEIQTSVSLDRETVNRHMLTVVAADNDSPESLSSQVEVLVLVEDVNDNPPVFVEKEYSLSLSLYTQPGLLLRVNVRQVLCFWVKNGLCFILFWTIKCDSHYVAIYLSYTKESRSFITTP